MVSLTQFVVWIIVGLLGGSVAGLIIKRERRGFGVWRNLGLGLIGALVGGLLFWLLGLFPGLDSVRISLRDVVAAIVGSFLVLGALGSGSAGRGRPEQTSRSGAAHTGSPPPGAGLTKPHRRVAQIGVGCPSYAR